MKQEAQVINSTALDAIKRLADAGMESAPLLETVGSSFANKVRMLFRKGEDPYGRAWASISHRKGQPLRYNGILQRSITHSVSTAGSETVLQIGTNTVYARLHQFGGQGKKAQIGAHTRKITKVFGRRVKPRAVNVRSHTRTMNQKARPFLPTPEQGIPENWDKSAMAAITAAMNKVIGSQ